MIAPLVVGYTLTLLGLISLVWLVRARDLLAFQSSRGLQWHFLGFALLTNAAILLRPGHSQIPLGLLTVALIVSALFVAQPDDYIGGGHQRAIAWVLCGVLQAWCFIVDYFVPPGIFGDRSWAYGLIAVWWIGLGVLLSRLRVSPSSFAYVSAAVLVFMVIPTAWSPNFWKPCVYGTLQKCSAVGQLYTSFSDSENYVAIVASIVLATSLIGLTGFGRVLLGALSVLVIVSTGSKTAMLSLGILAVWLVLSFIYSRHRRVSVLPAGLSAILATGAVASGLVLTYCVNEDAFSRRGAIWIAARQYVDGNVLTGVGISKWVHLQQVDQSPQHFFHSGYVLLYFSGGITALIIFGFMIYSVLRIPDPTGRAFITKSPVILFPSYSLTEVLWNTLAVDGLTWIVVGLLALCGNQSRGKGKCADNAMQADGSDTTQKDRVSQPDSSTATTRGLVRGLTK